MKRILIITYYWPPTAGSGVQRWLKFAKYLPEYGWQPVIYTPENPDINLKDHSLTNDISKHTEVLKTKIYDPSRIVQVFNKKDQKNDGHSRSENKSLIFQFGRWIKGNFFIPDSRVLWKRKSVQYLTTYLTAHPVDMIVSTGPPHSLHLIASALSKRFKIPWLMDLRDPISKLISLKSLKASRWSKRKIVSLEKKWLDEAALILSTSPGMPQSLVKFDLAKFHCIPNGYDEEDMPALIRAPTNQIVLMHGGRMSNQQNPILLWKCLDERIQLDKLFGQQFSLRLAGLMSQEVEEDLKSLPALYNRTQILGFLSHGEVLRQYQDASHLLLLNFEKEDDAIGVIPGKLFEYLGSNRPILSLGPANSDYLPFIKGHKFITHLSYDDKFRIQQYVQNLNTTDGTWSYHQHSSKFFSRREQCIQLAGLLESRICL